LKGNNRRKGSGGTTKERRGVGGYSSGGTRLEGVPRRDNQKRGGEKRGSSQQKGNSLAVVNRWWDGGVAWPQQNVGVDKDQKKEGPSGEGEKKGYKKRAKKKKKSTPERPRQAQTVGFEAKRKYKLSCLKVLAK